MPSLDDLLDLARDQARNVLIGAPKGTQLVPTWLVHAANGDVIIIQTPWADDRQKAITAQAMRETMRERKALAYSFLSEAWMSRRRLAPGQTLQDVLDKRHADGEMPRNDPERVEMVIATAGDTKGSKSRMWGIVRDKAGVVTDLVAQIDAPDMVVGRFEDCLVEARQ
jgi:hypothetical protein